MAGEIGTPIPARDSRRIGDSDDGGNRHLAGGAYRRAVLDDPEGSRRDRPAVGPRYNDGGESARTDRGGSHARLDRRGQQAPRPRPAPGAGGGELRRRYVDRRRGRRLQGPQHALRCRRPRHDAPEDRRADAPEALAQGRHQDARPRADGPRRDRGHGPRPRRGGRRLHEEALQAGRVDGPPAGA